MFDQYPILEQIRFEKFASFDELSTSLSDGSAALEKLPDSEFVSCAWQFFGLRGYEILHWHLDRVSKCYFTFGFNQYTELCALIYVNPHARFSAHDIEFIEELREDMHRCDLVCVVSRWSLPPAPIISHLCQLAVERIEIPVLKQWLVESHNADGGLPVGLFSGYLNTMIHIGTIGLEGTETGRILLPNDFGVRSFSDLLEQLGVSRDARETCQRVQYLPLEIIRTISRQPEPDRI
ncbi:hypothetical protein [Mesorhizobium australicum]|uniref:hypothetical protein n=1 Tax=Mesorhizobium australicum TaxID=536018 RepID=UPI00333CB595